MLKTSIKERNKAIRLAWEREQKLVAEGKGTRDWSQAQQKDILDPDKGKAYDENGRAFEGQHMKSVSDFLNIRVIRIIYSFLQEKNIWRLIKVVGRIRLIGTIIRKQKS